MPAADLATESTDTDATSTGGTSTGEATTQPTTSTDVTGSASSSTGDATSDATTGAAYIETDKHEEIPEQSMTCGLPELCPGAVPLTFDIIEPDGWTTDDIDRARCMAAAMRDRTPGIVSFQHYGGNAGEDLRTIEILGGQAIVTHTESSDFNVDYTERLVLVQIPAYFDECANGSASAIHQCLTEGFDVVCIDTLTCPE